MTAATFHDLEGRSVFITGGGSIVNFTSISYMMGNAGYPAYTAANAGINGMTRSLASSDRTASASTPSPPAGC